MLGGDFNSLPVSSVMSVFHDEPILDNENEWLIPSISNEKKAIQDFYKSSNDIIENWKSKGRLEPLIGKINSAYNLYNNPEKIKVKYELSFSGI